MHETHHFLATLTVVLCSAAVTTVLFQRMKQPVVLGYMLAGMIVGPYVPIPIEADANVVHTLAELGVILLMFSLGIEFSLPKLLRVGATAGFTAIVQCSLMIWLGYLAGQAFGWSRLMSFYAGAAIAISSTTIIVKAFEEQKIRGDFTHIVFGVLIVEDLIAILLITVLTAVSSGQEMSTTELAIEAGKLSAFLGGLMIVGLLTVPPMIRFVVRLDRAETTVVTGVGLAFGLAYLAAWFGYSVALGAFLAGSLVAESGVEKKVEHLVQPVRDIFAAMFFVSVGMLIDPREIVLHWPAVLAFLTAVVFGKVFSVTLGAFLTGQSVRTSVKAGMSLAQIGEFSFIIAALGMTTGGADKLLYSIAVAVSGITTLMTPWLIRAAEPSASFIDRKLPRSLQTFVALYASWIEGLSRPAADGWGTRLRKLLRWLAVDAIFVAAIVIGASLQLESIAFAAQHYLGVPERLSALVVVVGAAAIASPFVYGMLRVVKFIGFELAERAFPQNGHGDAKAVDLAAAPRRLLVVTLQLAVVVLVGFPLMAITQPFLPPLSGAIVIGGILLLSAFSFWRRANNFQGHAKAAAMAIAESLGRQTRAGRADLPAPPPLEEVNKLITGLGSPVPIRIAELSPAVGKTLAELNLRGLTGATVLAIRRGEDAVLVPSGRERLQGGDVLAVAGTRDAVELANQLLGDERHSPFDTMVIDLHAHRHD